MTKFKVGDRVRAIRSTYELDGIKKGQTGIVKNVDDFAFFVYPDVLNTELSNGEWCFFAEQLELVEDQPLPTPEYSCIRVVPPSKPKREIVVGEVLLADCSSLNIVKVVKGAIKIDARDYWLTAKALREAAVLFTTLAEVLEENENA